MQTIEEKREILDRNLARLFSQAEGSALRFLHQAHELSLIINDLYDIDSAYSLINDEYEKTRENERCNAFLWLRSLSEVIYDSLDYSLIREHLRSQFSSFEESDERSLGKISYIRNKYTERAFDRFAKLIEDAKVLHADSFEDSCMDVYNGICEYCILPTENSVDGRLSAFGKLIEKYDLHIAATTTIPDGESYTEVALLARDIDFQKFGDSAKQRMLEISLTSPIHSTSDINGILSFANAYGLILSRIDSRLSADGVRFTILLSADNVQIRNIEILVLCLLSIYPSFTVTGFYKHIN